MVGENGKVLETREEIFIVPSLSQKEVRLISNCILRTTAWPVSGEEGLKNPYMLDEAVNVS
jgi:hypothetical protein